MTSRSRTTGTKPRRAHEFPGRRADVAQLDLLDASATAAFVDRVAEQFGGVHTLVHASGPLVRQVYVGGVDPAAFRDHLEQEVMAFYDVVHPAIPHLRAASGSIVAVTSAGGRRHPARDALSVGPKGTIEALVRALAVEEGRFGIRANCVGPGMLTDGMARRLRDRAGHRRRRRVRGLNGQSSFNATAFGVTFILGS